jgi:hypothetical protein
MAADSQRKTAQTACWAVTMTKVRIRQQRLAPVSLPSVTSVIAIQLNRFTLWMSACNQRCGHGLPHREVAKSAPYDHSLC